MTRFLLEATRLVRTAMIAREVGGGVSNPGSLRDEATAPSGAPSPAPERSGRGRRKNLAARDEYLWLRDHTGSAWHTGDLDVALNYREQGEGRT
jgi:hypothetical protein